HVVDLEQRYPLSDCQSHDSTLIECARLEVSWAIGRRDCDPPAVTLRPRGSKPARRGAAVFVIKVETIGRVLRIHAVVTEHGRGRALIPEKTIRRLAAPTLAIGSIGV